MAEPWFSCLCLWRSPERVPLLNSRPSTTFPPPHTILTAPVARVRPLAQLASLLRRPLSFGEPDLAGAHHRSYDSRHSHHSQHTPPDSESSSRPLSIIEYAERRREERNDRAQRDRERRAKERMRQKTISSAYGSLMCRVDRSVPPTPTFIDSGYERTVSNDHLAMDTPSPRPGSSPSPPDSPSQVSGMTSPVETIPSRPLVTPLPSLTRRLPPGLLVTPALSHPSTIPPLSPSKPLTGESNPFSPATAPTTAVSPLTPVTPTSTSSDKRGRALSRQSFTMSRDSSAATHSTGPSRNTSLSRASHISRNSRASLSRTSLASRASRDLLSESEAAEDGHGVVYKEIGLAGLMSPGIPSPTKRKRTKPRKRTRISWVDEKEQEMSGE